MSDFSKEEIVALKELAQEHLFHRSIIEGLEYRNRSETYDDAYNNLKKMGFTEKEIIERIGKKSPIFQETNQ